MEPIIEVKHLSKKYNITHQQGGYVALRDVLASIVKRPFSFLKHKAKKTFGGSTQEEFWALDDVSFTINKGEVVGVIGRNGAGKSTLLKILTGITPPTKGEAILRGRVSSLLEVGTGFHPELTGRENIFLNGAILGMTRKEIARKFDEIVAFAGVEQFLDTPVKRYSSGMYVRLAFSVAAHMEPDILIVDEVLAVGDAEFQKKCLGKMEEVTTQEGRTIIFVSHNINAIEKLCKKSIVLEKGKVRFVGDTEEAVSLYLEQISNFVEREDVTEKKRKHGNLNVQVTDISFYDEGGNKIERGRTGQTLTIGLGYKAKHNEPLKNCRIAVSLRTPQGQDLFVCSSEITHRESIELPPSGEVRCTIPALPLSEGKYIMSMLFMVDQQIEDHLADAAILEVSNGDFYGTGLVAPPHWEGKGVLVNHTWNF